MDGVGAGVGLRDADAQLVVGVGVPVVGEGHDHDHGVVEEVGGGQRGADEGDGGEVGRAVAGEDEQQARAEAADLLQLGGGEGVGDGHHRAAGVLLAHLLGREVEATEGAVLRVRQRGHLAGGRHDAGQREALGVDQLDLVGGGQVTRQVEGEHAARGVERGQRVHGPGGEELEVVELARAGVVLGCRHGSILPVRRR